MCSLQVQHIGKITVRNTYIFKLCLSVLAGLEVHTKLAYELEGQAHGFITWIAPWLL